MPICFSPQSNSCWPFFLYKRYDDTRKTLLKAWQTKKQEIITHPFLQEKLEWGLVPYAQAMLLARFIRGDLDGYPPFMWK